MRRGAIGHNKPPEDGQMHPIIATLVGIIIVSTAVALTSSSHGGRTLADIMADLEELHRPSTH